MGTDAPRLGDIVSGIIGNPKIDDFGAHFDIPDLDIRVHLLLNLWILQSQMNVFKQFRFTERL